MNSDVIQSLPEFLLRASLAMALTAIGIILLLRILRLHSPALHRVAWVFVLLQGVIFTRVAWEIPWYEPVHQASKETSGTAVPDSAIAGPVAVQPGAEGAPDHGSDQAVLPTPEIAGNVGGRTGSMATESVDPVPDPARNESAVTGWSGWLPGYLPPLVSRLSWGTGILLIWLAGMAAVVCIYFASYMSLLFSMRKAAPAQRRWVEQWHRILMRAGVRHSVPLVVHPSLGPLLCRTPGGYQVVVPRELWEELDQRQRAAVLNHELAHFLRGDIWKSLVARLIALPHWFNPIAWLAVKKFDECGEWACDRYLIENDPHRGAAFAEALLRIVQFPKPAGVGVSGAGGSLLRERIRRLCGINQVEESVVKRVTSIVLLMTVFAFGLAEFRLVARAIAQEDEATSQESSPPQRDVETDAEKIQQLSDSLIVQEDDQVLASFREVLATRPGQTALLERASRLENAARQAARENALPTYLDEHFERQNGQLVLKPGQSGFADSFLEQSARYEQDVAEIQTALDEIGERLARESEAEKMLGRLIDHPLAAWVLYAAEAGRRVRPDQRTILELYQSIFVVSGDGELIIRPGVRARVEEQLARGPVRRKALVRIRAELLALGDEIAEIDDTHRRLKEVFADEYFAAFCCFDSIGQNGDPEQGIENLFNYFDRILEDHSDGLRLNKSGRETVERQFQSFTNRREAARRLKEPVESFAERIPAGYDELHDRVREAFDSELVLAMLTRDPSMRATSGDQYVQFTMGQRLAEADDGLLHVKPDQQDQVVEYARRMLQTTRALRRRFAAVDDQMDQVADTTLREAFQTPAGRYVMIRSVNGQIADRRYDGLGMWIDDHFSKTGDGRVLKEDARSEISEILDQVKNIQAELEKDDF